ncbi:MAG: protein kinase [Planctomycetes bacterium]|nr:protein kinase [Planctomycetota bacterium]
MEAAEELLLDALADQSHLDEAQFDSLCARHPEHASELRQVYASYRAVEHSLRSAADSPSASDRATSLAAGRFRVLGELGRGGMSIVYAAWDSKLRRKVALKTLLPFTAEGPLAAARLQRRRARLTHEAQVLAQLDHPGIVPVYDVVHDDDGAAYVAMLRVRGVDLRAIYQRAWNEESEWSLARVVGVLLRVCEALSYAHGKGVLHRDLKPANVMVGAYGEAYVMDWGLARTGAVEPAEQDADSPRSAPTPASDGSLSLVATDRDDSDSAAALRTQRGDVLGTPSYMSPEQAAGELERVDGRSDVYSVGAMLYELLARTAPYVRPGEASTSTQILSALREAPPAPLAELAPDAPSELIAIADKAMSRAPEQRYTSMAELADDLRAFLEGRVVRAYRTGAWAEARKWIGRHRAVVGVLAALLVTLIGALITFAVLLDESERSRMRLQAAQVAAQRANAVSGYRVSPYPCLSFVDEFDGPTMHRRWTASSRADLVSQCDGALALHSEADAQQTTAVLLDRYQHVIYGDFDVRLHFRVEGFDAPTQSRAERQVTLGVMAAQSDQLLAVVSRCAERDPPAFAHSEQSYRAMSFADGGPRFLPETCAAAEGRAGVLRIARVGERISTYYWSDGWRQLGEESCTRDPAGVYFEARTYYAAEPFDVFVERFELFTDEQSVLEPIPEIHEDFVQSKLDQRFVVFAMGGVAVPVDGRLHLQTFDGGGVIRMMLDMLRWKISGDFEWQAQFELHELPYAPQAVNEVRVEIHTAAAQGLHATLAFRAGPTGGSLLAFNHRERVERPLDFSSGRMRFVRRGADLETWIETRGQWERLLVRSALSPKTDLAFSIRVESPDGAPGVLVSFDDLSVTGLSER